MKVYKTQDIRNVAVLGHGGCGKTTLVEAMANVTGVTSVSYTHLNSPSLYGSLSDHSQT